MKFGVAEPQVNSPAGTRVQMKDEAPRNKESVTLLTRTVAILKSIVKMIEGLMIKNSQIIWVQFNKRVMLTIVDKMFMIS